MSSQWIPLDKDTLPKFGVPVLISTDSKVMPVDIARLYQASAIEWADTKSFSTEWHEGSSGMETFWGTVRARQPLPEPYKKPQ